MSTVVEKSPLSISTPGMSDSGLCLANRRHSPNFRGWERTKCGLFLRLPPAGLLVDNDYFSFGGHTSSWNSLRQLLREQFSLQFPYSPPFDLQSQDGTGSHCFQQNGASISLGIPLNSAPNLETSPFIKISSITSFHSAICFLSRPCLI